MTRHVLDRRVHYWTDGLDAPPCGTTEDPFDGSDAIEDVTCESCRGALAGDGGDLAAPARTGDDGAVGGHPTP